MENTFVGVSLLVKLQAPVLESFFNKVADCVFLRNLQIVLRTSLLQTVQNTGRHLSAKS